jgi:hypothetical protein
MLDWLSRAFFSLSSVWRKLNPSGDGREADFAKHCIRIILLGYQLSLIILTFLVALAQWSRAES